MSDWRDDAACRDDRVDPEVFFPSPPGYRRAVILAPARAICRGCEVQVQCLDDVLRLPSGVDTVGVRAGLTPAERRDLRSDPSLVVVDDVSLLRGGPPEGTRPGLGHSA